MKKMFLVLVLLFLSTIVFGQNNIIISQQQFDAIDFSTFNLEYQFNIIRYELDDGIWSLNSDVTFLNATFLGDFYGDGVNQYEVQLTTFTYSAPLTSVHGFSYFSCIFLGGNDLQCFLDSVVPIWSTQFLVNDWIHRLKLASMQTGGEPMMSQELEEYLTG